MRFDLFVSDYDKTLGDAPDYISEENIKAIKEYTERGGTFVICTGRMFSSIRQICLKYGLKGIVVSYQGAKINDIETGKSLFEGGIDYNLAIEVVKQLLKEGIDIVLGYGDDIVYQKDSLYVQGYLKAIQNKGKKVDGLVDFILDKKTEVNKVCAVAEPEDIERLTEKYSKILGDKFICNNGASMLLEVINAKYSKKFAVEYLSKYYNIPFEKIIAVGDSTNDLPLLGGPWHKVAVGDADKRLKAIADEITVEFKDNPVSYLLKKYCL